MLRHLFATTMPERGSVAESNLAMDFENELWRSRRVYWSSWSSKSSCKCLEVPVALGAIEDLLGPGTSLVWLYSLNLAFQMQRVGLVVNFYSVTRRRYLG